ncbi:MAG: molybdopterin molybdenumtransferase MoeA [Campylobacteraceae bacterium 4484_4]|nr:MAG: molybdopterin molybdenumtransferase MoeA [Campylobacteraceae bacterium 4484_4]
MAFISFEESMKIMQRAFTKRGMTQMRFLSDAAGYVLAEDIVAMEDSPAYPTAAMDGYALKCEDQSMGRVRILGDLPAGSINEEEVIGGTCVKTFTGSLMSPGTDTLIPIENVIVEGDEIVIKEEVPCGYSVRPVGENFKKGEVLIPKGTKLGFAQIGVLASLNIPQVKVYAAPRVAVLSTGSEILDVGEPQSNPSQIRSANQFVLEALAKNAGADVLRLPLAKDDRDSIKEVMTEALRGSDILVTTGGVSVGDYDFVKEILQEMETEYLIEGVVLKPGQHIKVVKTGGKFIFSLPGFPYSAAVTFILYVWPLIDRMRGGDGTLPIVRATLEEAYKKRSQKTEFTACNLRYEEGRYLVNLRGKKSGSSAILTNLLGETGLLWIDKEQGDLEAGSEVDVIDLSRL